MPNLVLDSCINAIAKSTSPGFGFVFDFIDAVLSQGDVMGTEVKHAISIWNYVLPDGEECKAEYFSSSTLNLIGLNRKRLLACDHPVMSGGPDVSDFVDDGFVWKDRFLALPMNSFGDSDEFFNVRGAIILLFESPVVRVDETRVQLWHVLLNSKKPIVFDSLPVQKFFSEFSHDDNDEKSIGNRWFRTTKALKCLCQDKDVAKHDCGVKYASFWKLNDFNNIEQEPFLKQMDCCFNKVCPEYHTHIELQKKDEHYLNYFRSKEEKDFLMCSHAHMHESIADGDFFDTLGLDENTLTTLAIPFYSEDGIPSMDICCLYIKDFLFTPFVSLAFCNSLKQLIYNDLSSVEKEIESRMVTYLMQMYLSYKDTTSFYNSVSEVISKFNSVAKCLIYIKGNQNDLVLASEEDINDAMSYKTKSYKIGSRSCYIPAEYAEDNEFVGFLSNLPILELNPSANVALFQSDNADSPVRNVACIAIQNNKNKKEVSGVILLINRVSDKKQDGMADIKVMTVDNVSATYLSALYLHQFYMWNKAIHGKNYLLKKLRHEIPHCTRVIGDKLGKIKQYQRDKGLLTEDFMSYANAVELNKNRINMLASFFAAVDYDDARFASSRRKLDVVRIINDNMPLFKEEAFEKGVDVVFKTSIKQQELMISEFYPLAIVNMVNNAIRYCSKGTNVIVSLYPDRIEVSDIGIPIPSDELELIFVEGFRGVYAKSVDAKGMGYGLHISKRVLESHGSTIQVESDYLGEENYYLEYVISNYIKNLEGQEKSDFIYATVEPSEMGIVDRLLAKVSSVVVNTNYEYCNNKMGQIKKWMEHERKEGGAVFIEMDEGWFQDSIAKVKFTVLFGNEIIVRI